MQYYTSHYHVDIVKRNSLLKSFISAPSIFVYASGKLTKHLRHNWRTVYSRRVMEENGESRTSPPGNKMSGLPVYSLL